VTFDPAGNLYSTASENGVFELQRNTRKLRSFLFNITDGSGPGAGVIVDTKNQATYGTTGGGGSGQGGVVFKIVTSGKEAVLYSFCQQTNCADGQLPYASLIEDQTGNLYGTTYKGGTNNQGAKIFALWANGLVIPPISYWHLKEYYVQKYQDTFQF
jgi:uncharacterized repeat protein (TIGR03803 family)